MPKPKTAAKKPKRAPAAKRAVARKPTEAITSYKGFGMNWKCRDFQFKVGKTYEHSGPLVACESGFHACENLLDVFSYYPPGTSRYAAVTQSGEINRGDTDSKIASAQITIDRELKLADFITRAVAWVIAHATNTEGQYTEGYRSAASSTGYLSAAMSAGYKGRVMGEKIGTALFLVERNDRYDIINVWAGIVGRDGIKPSTWYTLRDGKPVEV